MQIQQCSEGGCTTFFEALGHMIDQNFEPLAPFWKVKLLYSPGFSIWSCKSWNAPNNFCSHTGWTLPIPPMNYYLWHLLCRFTVLQCRWSWHHRKSCVAPWRLEYQRGSLSCPPGVCFLIPPCWPPSLPYERKATCTHTCVLLSILKYIKEMIDHITTLSGEIPWEQLFSSTSDLVEG